MIEAGQMGRKSGSGFADWDGKKAIRPRGTYDPDVMDAIAADMLAPLVAECRAAVDEGVSIQLMSRTRPVFSASAFLHFAAPVLG